MFSGYDFAVPSFWSGVARTFDLWGTFDTLNATESSEAADKLAHELDWLSVGVDILDAMRELKPEVDRLRESQRVE